MSKANIGIEEKSSNRFKDSLPITIILFVSAFLNIFNIWKLGFANKYYAAGVYSMGQNLHAFFYNSLDSVGFVTIDKPPLGFWIQVLFTKVFGFDGAVLILPQAIAAVISVYLIYGIIKRRFTKGAGLIAAVVLALTPIYAAVSRNNTIDGILILLLVLAAQQAILAAEKSSMKHLIFAGIFIGLGFNVKMLQAYVIVPAIYLTYLIFAKQKFIKKILVCALAVAIMAVISLSWVVIVDAVPEENRPYIGSSETNSAMNLALGYNGINRIFGKNSILRSNDNKDNFVQPVQDNQNNSNVKPAPQNNRPNQNNQQSNTGQNIQPNNQQNVNQPLQQNTNTVQKNTKGGESGLPGITRLYNEKNAGQIAWFILPCIFTCVLMLWLIITGKFENNPKNISMLFFALCFIPIFIYFSFSSGLAHRYYFATIAPFAAGLTGIGFYHLMKGKRFWIPMVFIPAALAQLYIQYLYKGWWDVLLPIMVCVFAAAIIVMIVGAVKKIPRKAFALLLCTLLILPAVWSATPMIYYDNSQLPIAGPELIGDNDKFDIERDLSGLVEYLEENREGATYLAVTKSSMDFGAELILESGEAIMALGGFNGGDKILTIREFVDMVKAGEVRYAVFTDSSKNVSQAENGIYQWVEKNGKVVRPIKYGGMPRNVVVYKLS